MVQMLVDIDGVLAKGNIPCFVALCNRALKLDIPNDQLAGVQTYDEFRVLPQVQAHIARIGEDRYQRRLELLRWHPEYIPHCHVIQDALSGVQALAQMVDELGYCTARVINFDAQWNRHVSAATHLWLKLNQFPNFRLVDFCDGFTAKMRTIAQKLRAEPDSQIWLIDDSAEKLLEAFFDLSPEDQSVLVERFTLVAYGYERGQEVEHPLSVSCLDEWKHVCQLEKEFISYAKSRPEQSRVL